MKTEAKIELQRLFAGQKVTETNDTNTIKVYASLQRFKYLDIIRLMDVSKRFDCNFEISPTQEGSLVAVFFDFKK